MLHSIESIKNLNLVCSDGELARIFHRASDSEARGVFGMRKRLRFRHLDACGGLATRAPWWLGSLTWVFHPLCR